MVFIGSKDDEILGLDDDLASFAVRSDYQSDDSTTLPVVWARSDAVARALDSVIVTPESRAILLQAVERQLNTAWYYLLLRLDQGAARGTTSTPQWDSFALVFPGETRDNTGVKDLNDKILGYQLNNRYRDLYQAEIRTIFNAHQLHIVGQNYKSAYFATPRQEHSRRRFDRGLLELDAALRRILLALLDEQPEKERTKEGRELQEKLRRDEQYRFEIFYGMTTLENHPGAPMRPAAAATWQDIGLINSAQPLGPAVPRDLQKAGPETMDTMFQAVTETLKAAAMSRILYNVNKHTRDIVPKIPVDESVDRRGQVFSGTNYARFAGIARAVKAVVRGSRFPDYSNIYINTVYTKTFLDKTLPNRDVVRDIRKKKFVGPPPGQQVGLSATKQRAWLEVWLTGLNTLDFIKDFHTPTEYPDLVGEYHEKVAEAILDLTVDSPAVDLGRVREVIDKDLRQDRAIAIFGTGSEYAFYNEVSNYSRRIFFSMDIRDFGVDVLANYDAVNEKVVADNLQGRKLLRATLQSTDWVALARRRVYETTEKILRSYHPRIVRPRGFAEDVQTMLGGDELFVATDPRFAPYIANILRDMDANHLNLRCGIVHSVARSAAGDKQRRNNQLAHQEAMSASDRTGDVLKYFERLHSRIERLIGKLDDDEAQAPPDGKRGFLQKLNGLQLLKMYAEFVMPPRSRSAAHVEEVLRRLKEQVDAEGVVDDVKLYRFDGTEVSQEKLRADVAKLEDRVREKVGDRNVIRF
jgi:hypothetical protein